MTKGPLNEFVEIAKVDATVHKFPEYGVKSFPTLKYFKKTSSGLEVVDYKSGRDLKSFYSFLNA